MFATKKRKWISSQFIIENVEKHSLNMEICVYKDS